MKKWLTGLLSGSSGEKKNQDKKGKQMSKAKPTKMAAKSKSATPSTSQSAKAAKPAAKTTAKTTDAKGKAEPKARATEAKPAKALKAAPAAEKPVVSEVPTAKAKAAAASPPEKKPKKGAAKDEPTITSSGLVDTATPENKKKWRDLREKFAKEKAPTYSMSAQFEAERPIEHKVLGWGYIMTNNNDRLEVLFETGVKILISNYRA